MTDTLPYGTWPSPLSAADLAAGATAPADLLAAGGRLVWIESRPTEGGRQALVAWDGTEVEEVAPAGWNARTRVHEYGGAPFSVIGDQVVASRWEDQRLYRVGPDGAQPLTPQTQTPAATRWADGRATPDGRWLIVVRETHGGDGEPANEIVALDVTDGSQRVLVTGRDFVQAPRPSPDGTRLAWLAWDHPFMPWDSAEVWVADLADGALTGARHIAGRDGASVVSPEWLPDGRLAYAEDGSGHWEVYLAASDGVPVRVSTLGADVGAPGWTFGTQTIAGLPDGRVACVVTEHAAQRVVLLDPATGATTDLALPYTAIAQVRPFADGVAFLAAAADGARAVVVWTPQDGHREVRRYAVPALRPGDHPDPRAVEVATPDGGVTHAFLYLPANAEVVGPDDDRPPLVVFTHGGPTGNVAPVTTGAIAYWTTRGFAVADVNYRGSTGFGRAYRDALLGRWGDLDVVDTITVANHLADRGLVDRDRMTIRGGSAGGYTTLAVLTTPGHPFACGTSFFGVADLRLLAEHTHKFESRYLDRLVGPLPEAADLYRERSPLHRAHLLSRPLLVLQGLEDEVVPPEQAEAIVAAAAQRRVPHAYIAFEGEQHGFRIAANIITWLGSELAFYGQVLGFTPDGDLPTLDLGGR